jgi:hypothetical protein
LSEQSAYIGDFDGEFGNAFYNSMFDNIENLGFTEKFCASPDGVSEAENFAKLATMISQSAVDLALEGTSNDGEFIKDIIVEAKTIQELFCCFLGNPQECDYVSDLFNVTYSGYMFPGNGEVKLPEERPTRLCKFLINMLTHINLILFNIIKSTIY